MTRRILLVFSLTIIIICSSIVIKAGDDKVVGLFLDGYQDGCKIIREDRVIKEISKNESLYSGDLVVKQTGIDSVKIKYHPYTEGKKIDNKTLKIVFNPPEEKQSLWSKVISLLGFEQSRHKVYYAVTRGVKSNKIDLMYYPILRKRGFLYQNLPFDRSLVFKESKVKFRSPDLTNNLLIITDVQGNHVLKQKITAVDNSYELDLARLSLKPGEDYYWKIGTEGTERIFTVLETSVQQDIQKALQTIEEQENDILSYEIRQIIFLKSVSEMLNSKGNLYWLCYQLLEDVVNKAATDEQYRLSSEEEVSIEIVLQEIDMALFL